MRSTQLIRSFAFALALLVGAFVAAPPVATAAPVTAQHSAPAQTTTRAALPASGAEAAAYSAREAAASKMGLEGFEGGVAVVLIGSSAALIVVTVVLLLVLI